MRAPQPERGSYRPLIADDARPHDPTADLNRVLSEVIDVVQDVKQAHRKVPETHALHAVLDRLFGDLRSWARLLMDRDVALGVSALDRMPTVAGRKPPNLWPGPATDEEVRRIVGDHLDRLGQHVAAALAEQDDDGSRVALATVERELLAHRRALSEL
jgi:DNA-binding ferritin-like protein